jgi:hypothetical protein
MTDIRILTYNVLAAVFVKKQYYPNTPSNLLDYQNRREHTHVFYYDQNATQLRRNCDRTVTRNCEKLRRSYA